MDLLLPDFTVEERLRRGILHSQDDFPSSLRPPSHITRGVLKPYDCIPSNHSGVICAILRSLIATFFFLGSADRSAGFPRIAKPLNPAKLRLLCVFVFCVVGFGCNCEVLFWGGSVCVCIFVLVLGFCVVFL